MIKNCYQKHPNFDFITGDETRNYEIFDVMNINLNNLDASLGFTKISWDTINEFNAFILYLINRGLYATAEVASNDDKLMALVTCDPRDSNKRIVLLAKNGF